MESRSIRQMTAKAASESGDDDSHFTLPLPQKATSFVMPSFEKLAPKQLNLTKKGQVNLPTDLSALESMFSGLRVQGPGGFLTGTPSEAARLLTRPVHMKNADSGAPFVVDSYSTASSPADDGSDSDARSSESDSSSDTGYHHSGRKPSRSTHKHTGDAHAASASASHDPSVPAHEFKFGQDLKFTPGVFASRPHHASKQHAGSRGRPAHGAAALGKTRSHHLVRHAAAHAPAHHSHGHSGHGMTHASAAHDIDGIDLSQLGGRARDCYGRFIPSSGAVRRGGRARW